MVIGGCLVVGILVYIYIKRSIKLPFANKIENDHELQVFAAILLCFGGALLASAFGLSPALGAFVGGMVMHVSKATDWIYDNIFQFSQDQFEEYRDLIVQDQKRAFRNQQIAAEGNDPVETGRSYGTPHDLASLYGRERYDDASVPDGYNEKEELGRPKEKASNINTQDNAFGKDRLGRKDMKVDDQESYGKLNFKGGSPLALENAEMVYNKNRSLIEGLSKQLVFQKDKAKESLLDESNLTE